MKKLVPDTEAASPKKISFNNVKRQRERALVRLREGPVTTIELRRDEDIIHPSARIWELRHRFGHQISTIKAIQPTECGRLHEVAKYVLVKEADDR